jgi:hypothetical protein
VQNTNIATNATDIGTNTTAIGTKVATSTYDSEKAVQNTNIATNATAIGTNATAIAANVLQSAYDTKQGTQDTAIAQNAADVASINSLDSTQTGRLDGHDSLIATKASLTAANVYTGTQTIRDSLAYQERVQALSVSSSVLTYAFGNGPVAKVTPEAAVNFDVQITGCNSTSTTTTNVLTLLVDCSTYECYASTCKVNGTTRSLVFSGGAAAIDIEGASVVQQTIAVVWSGNSAIPYTVMSSVVPFMA